MTFAPRSASHVMQLATSEVEPEPAASSALQIVSGELNATPVTPRPLFAMAAIVPATCVPWPLSSRHEPARTRPPVDWPQSAVLPTRVLVVLGDPGVDDADLHAA